MASVINVAPGGDLVVAVGKDTEQNLARVSGVLLRIASPVFNTMLGPAEGQATHDASNPLKLSDDDPNAMINLCQILHWNSKSVDMSEPNWLQKLVVVCDKYGCAPKLRDFFLVKVVDKRPCAIDHFVITSLIEDRQGFAKISDTVLRTPRRELEATGHEQLLQMLPAGFLGEMQVYRSQAGVQHLAVAQKPIISMLKISATAGTSSNHGLCVGLQKRLALYQKVLVDGGIVSEDMDKDGALLDMKELLSIKFATSTVGSEINDFDLQRCSRGYCATCTWDGRKTIMDSVQNLTFGTKGCCYLCFGCFKAGNLALAVECPTHAPPHSPTKSTEPAEAASNVTL